jgi:hypothetical protein
VFVNEQRQLWKIAIIKPWKSQVRRAKMTLGTILLIVLLLALVGAIPTWGYSSGWGYGPSGGIGFVLLIVLILIMLGHI